MKTQTRIQKLEPRIQNSESRILKNGLNAAPGSIPPFWILDSKS